MDASLGEQQKETDSVASGTLLSAQQFYQHDPLLALLKDTLRLNNLWIIAGSMVLPAGFFLVLWFGWASKLRFWLPSNTLSMLLTFVLFPSLFLIYLLVPVSIARLFDTLWINGVIGEHRRQQSDAETYESSPLEMILLAAIYVALTPSLFIGWLLFPHRVMVRARDEALQPLVDEFQQALMQSLSSAEHDTHLVVARTRRLTALKQHYDLAYTTFPTWPIEISALSQLVVTVILPLILSLIGPLITPIMHALSFPY